jgi:hypothetical protein
MRALLTHRALGKEPSAFKKQRLRLVARCATFGFARRDLCIANCAMNCIAFASSPVPTRQSPGKSSTCGAARRPWTMGPWKPGEKEEAFRKQQEILARRRDKGKNNEYFESVEKRREQLESSRKERQLIVNDGEDPIIPWRELKEKGLLGEAGYPDEEPGGSAEGGIPLPMASFGTELKPQTCCLRLGNVFHRPFCHVRGES